MSLSCLKISKSSSFQFLNTSTSSCNLNSCEISQKVLIWTHLIYFAYWINIHSWYILLSHLKVTLISLLLQLKTCTFYVLYFTTGTQTQWNPENKPRWENNCKNIRDIFYDMDVYTNSRKANLLLIFPLRLLSVIRRLCSIF